MLCRLEPHQVQGSDTAKVIGDYLEEEIKEKGK
jgi:hypothetical protein